MTKFSLQFKVSLLQSIDCHLSLKRQEGRPGIPRDDMTQISSNSAPLRNADLTSAWDILRSNDNAICKNIRTLVNQTTGAYVSRKCFHKSKISFSYNSSFGAFYTSIWVPLNFQFDMFSQGLWSWLVIYFSRHFSFNEANVSSIALHHNSCSSEEAFIASLRGGSSLVVIFRVWFD